jgi:hypothetical protein
MTAESREELISAYVDDELSPGERALVERWLAEDADCRQFYEELRSLRSDLQSLPHLKLTKDLTPTVLGRAERAVLNGAEQPADATITPGELVRQWWTAGRGWRRIVWPVIAIAAALLIAVFDPSRQAPEKQVAQVHPPRGDMSIEAAPDPAQRAGNDSARAQPSVKLQRKAARDEMPRDDSPSDNKERDQLGDSYVPALAKDDKPVNASPAAAPKPDELRMAAPPGATAAAKPLSAGAVTPRQETATQQMKSTRNFLLPGNPPAERVKLAITSDVAVEFVREQTLEKILESNKIAWQRDDAVEALEPAVQPSDAARSLKKTKPEPIATQSYVIEATPTQVKQIATELDQDKARVRNVSNAVEPDAKRAAAKAREESTDDLAGRFRIMLRYTPQPAEEGKP